MTLSRTFVRALFLLLSIVFMLSYTIGSTPQVTLATWVNGSALGVGVAILLFALEQTFKRFNLRTFNTTMLGLFFGYLMALALLTLFQGIVSIAPLRAEIVALARVFLLLFGTFIGVMMTLRAAEHLTFSLPFLSVPLSGRTSRPILLDLSVLEDGRIVDLAASGILDHRLMLPHFLTESPSKHVQDTLGKLEALPHLNLRYLDGTGPEGEEVRERLLSLCRHHCADLLTAEPLPLKEQPPEDVRTINLHTLSNALRPLKQRGETLKIKVQRQGKEEGQGVGYLEDGAMVVINGGGTHLGETILTHVLSVKHTCSGRMIFCNVAEECE